MLDPTVGSRSAHRVPPPPNPGTSSLPSSASRFVRPPRSCPAQIQAPRPCFPWCSLRPPRPHPRPLPALRLGLPSPRRSPSPPGAPPPTRPLRCSPSPALPFPALPLTHPSPVLPPPAHRGSTPHRRSPVRRSLLGAVLPALRRSPPPGAPPHPPPGAPPTRPPRGAAAGRETRHWIKIAASPAPAPRRCPRPAPAGSAHWAPAAPLRCGCSCRRGALLGMPGGRKMAAGDLGELLVPHMPAIRVPRSGDRVYKSECAFSFDSPVSRRRGRGAGAWDLPARRTRLRDPRGAPVPAAEAGLEAPPPGKTRNPGASGPTRTSQIVCVLLGPERRAGGRAEAPDADSPPFLLLLHETSPHAADSRPLCSRDHLLCPGPRCRQL
ncbi:hypothetical protein P7K49_030032 [Saguinus oedipus]|uniref:Ubiquitinyl hydrolase variant UBP zinc finger domain-containing protein n=1 Tax=Saguinus oedipus TaxID=9490 RepID=A0ABQ9U104_SAGOE|nr:hypothetical protein P7K49_030032 [Saguinus oedipus]